MKALRFLFFLLASLCAAPFAVGIVDAWAWLIVSQSASWIDWTWVRGWLAAMFLVPATFCAMAAIGLRDAADR